MRFALYSTLLGQLLLPFAPVAVASGALPQDDEPSAQESGATTAPEVDGGGESGGVEAPANKPVAGAPARYRGLEELDELLARWTANGLAERLLLGESAGGQPLVGVVIAAPGPTPAAERTTVLVVGGLDGRSCAGSETAVRIVEDVLAGADRLPPDVAVVVVPWANPDGLTRTLGGSATVRNDAVVDDDQDGLSDEDGPDDIDGDGVILSMLVQDSEGPLARAADGRFLRPATSSDRERWRLVPEGRDDDGDGRFNEDGPGGIRLDESFPVGWRPALHTGVAPLMQSEARALAGLARSRRVAVALFLQGNHGHVAVPGGTPEVRAMLAPSVDADADAWSELVVLLGQMPGATPRDLLSATGRARGGHPVDWLYAALGALSVEWAVWGPEYGREPERSAAPREGSFSDLAGQPLELPQDQDLRGVAQEERRWARWLDDTRGGIGYVDWLPVDLVGGKRALVGGWEPRTWINPPEELLPSVVDGAGERVLALVEGLPRLSLEIRELKRSGGVVELSLSIRNSGRLPSGVGPTRDGRAALAMTLELPGGAELLAGELRLDLGHLAAGAASEPQTWLLRAKELSLLQVTLESAWGGSTREEVRL